MRIPPNHCPVVAPVITVPLAHVAAAAQRGGAHDPPTASACDGDDIAVDAAAAATDAAATDAAATDAATDDAALVRELIFVASQSMFSDFIRDEDSDMKRLSVMMIETAESAKDEDLASAMRAFGCAIGRIGVERNAGHG